MGKTEKTNLQIETFVKDLLDHQIIFNDKNRESNRNTNNIDIIEYDQKILELMTRIQLLQEDFDDEVMYQIK